MFRFPYPYLSGEVDLPEERERHIADRHPDLLPEHRLRITETLADPDLVRRSTRGNARLLSRWYTDLRGGKHVVVVVTSDPGGQGRHWIVTAYLARRLAEGALEWKRD